MIIFETVRYRNFLSTGNQWTTLTLNKNKNTLIIGKNGGGKSTLLDVICFVLYNKSFRGCNKPDLVNSINKKDALGEIKFSIGKNKYLVRRGIKPDLFEVFCNDTLLNQDAKATDYQAKFEKNILKMNFEAFQQIVILGSRNYIPFMRLKAEPRRKFIEGLLDLDVFSSMNVLLKKDIDVHETKLARAELDIERANNNIELEQKRLDMLKENNTQLIEDNKAKLQNTKERIDTCRANIDAILPELQKINDQLQWTPKLKKKSEEFNRLYHQIDSKIDNLKADIEFYSSQDNCPTCRQTIEPKFKAEWIETKTASLINTEAGLDKLKEQWSEVTSQLDLLNQLNNEAISYNLEITKQNTTIRNLQDMGERIWEEINDLQTRNSNITEIDVDLDKWQKMLDDASKIKEDAAFQLELMKAAGIILKDTGIKARIVKQYVPIINKLIGKHLAALDFFVNFELDENFNETIKSRHRDTFSYESFSEGERLRIDLAILFCWRAVAKLRVSASTNLLIMDEIFDGSLDSTGVDDLMKLLSVHMEESNVFIISHNADRMYEKYESVLKFEKVKNFSKMKVVK